MRHMHIIYDNLDTTNDILLTLKLISLVGNISIMKDTNVFVTKYVNVIYNYA